MTPDRPTAQEVIETLAARWRWKRCCCLEATRGLADDGSDIDLSVLANHAKRQHYLQDPFLDAGFSQTLLQALRERCESEKFELARALKDQALRGMGGFEPAELGD